MTSAPTLAAVVEAFRARLVARGEGADARLVETHISLVLLAGEFAYKFKKPVDFGFVDFTTLERRKYFCAREVALNARHAPRIYLGVETVQALGVSEYAVRMRRFGDEATLTQLLARDGVTAEQMAAFARALAAQHAAAPRADGPLGNAALARQQIEACQAGPLAALLPDALRTALRARLDAAMPLLAARHAEGHVRDCHGDLHGGNVVEFEGELQAFDCIEFNDELRVIDTLSDAAFLLMDLDYQGAARLGHAFLNAYLEQADDYAGLALLPLYCAYRALVRAKVALLRAAQDAGAAHAARADAERHVELAQSYLAPDGVAGLVLTHGVSGSGKSHHARRLAARAGFIHLRSDIERRRLAGLALDARSDSAPGAGLYGPDMNAATYARLLTLARHALQAGYSVVVDATFMTAKERAPFLELAAALRVPLHILACRASDDELRRRVATRAAQGNDASEATLPVLERQLRSIEGLNAHESALAVEADSLDDSDVAVAALGRPRAH
jgi:aminoglycoside phosphotransferase family enzyme/predicted kinase